MNPASTAPAKAALAADWRDKRVTAVVTLDLGLSRGMTGRKPGRAAGARAGDRRQRAFARASCRAGVCQPGQPPACGVEAVTSKSATPATSLSCRCANRVRRQCSKRKYQAMASFARMATALVSAG